MRRTWIVAACLASPVVVEAREDKALAALTKKVEEARFLAKQKEHEKATLLLAETIAAAQKAGALVAEQAAVDALDEVVESLPVEAFPAGSTEPVPFGRRRAVAGALAALDPKRRSAFASAPSMAHALLTMATAKGDGRFVAEAATVLEAHERAPKAGRGAVALARYATGMRRVAANDDAAAAPLLEDALASAAKDGWTDLAVAVATELAASRLRVGDAEGARAAIARAAAVVERGDDALMREWSALAAAGSPTPARRPLGAARGGVGGGRRGGAPGAAGGAGGAGGSGGGGRDVSKVGAAIEAHPRGKPLVSVERTKSKWTIRQGFDPKYQATFPVEDRLAHFADGGVTLSFHRESVGLYVVDPEGLRGQPGEGWSRPAARALYLVGLGETYDVRKDGTVTIE